MPGDREGFVLDGLDLNDDNFYILEAVDFPPPAKKPQWLENPDADGAVLGEEPRHATREVTARIRVDQQTTMDLAIDKIAALVDKLQKASRTIGGVPLVWTPANSNYDFTLYVLMGEIAELPIEASGDDAGYLLRFPVITVKLTCAPFGYGDWVTNVGTTSSAPVQWTEVNVAGDVDAEAVIVVTEGAAVNKMHCEVGRESELDGYVSASPSALIRGKAELTATGFAGTSQTRSGSWGSNVWRATLTTAPVTICGTDTSNAESRSHVGTFRIKLRCYAAGTGPYQVRLSWRAGSDGPFTSNAWAAPIDDQWSEVDLGLVTIPVATGLQTWEGRIEAQTETPGDTLDVDYIIIIPAAQYGRGRGLTASSSGGAAIAYDTFEHAAGALTGKTAPLGGTYQAGTAGGSTAEDGDADDFSCSGSGGAPEDRYKVTRAPAGADSSVTNGRYVTLSGSATIAALEALVDIELPIIGGSGLEVRGGILARFVDTDNWLMAVRRHVRDPDYQGHVQTSLFKRVAGSVTHLGTYEESSSGLGVYTTKLTVDAAGNAAVYSAAVGAVLGPAKISVTADSHLATGGALDDGRVGLYDASTVAGTSYIRTYDNYVVTAPIIGKFPACYASRKLEFRFDSAERENAAGTAWGEIPSHRGADFTLRPGKNRVVAKMRRTDVNDLRDALEPDATSPTDTVGLSTRHRPRWLVIPRA